MGDYIWLLLTFVSGLILGGLIAHRVLYTRNRMGTLNIDQTNPEKDVYNIEIDDLDKLPSAKHVLLTVKVTPSQN